MVERVEKVEKDEKVEMVEKVEILSKPGGRYNDSDGGVSPSKNVCPDFFFLFFFPFSKSPSGRHNNSDGGVSPS